MRSGGIAKKAEKSHAVSDTRSNENCIGRARIYESGAGDQKSCQWHADLIDAH